MQHEQMSKYDTQMLFVELKIYYFLFRIKLQSI